MGFSWGSITSRLKQHAETAAPFAKAAAPFAATALFPGGTVVAPLAYQLLKKSQQRAAAAPAAPEISDHEDDSLQSLAGYCGEEELELARSGGMAERQALRRRRIRSSGIGAAGVPHDVYRAAIWQRATKLAGGAAPQAKHLYQAQKTVDRDLHRQGSSIQIPGARPGRVTR